MDIKHKTNIVRKCPACGGPMHVIGGEGRESHAKCSNCGHEINWVHTAKQHNIKQSEEHRMESFKDLLDSVERGNIVSKVVENIGIGPDRADDIRSEEDRAEAFTAMVAKIASSYPYVDESWVQEIATQLRQGESAQELAQMATINRDMYAGSARIDAGGDFNTWAAILQSLLALPTDALPPAPAPLM